MLLHLDTDIGGDTDDVCALAMVLGWPGAELAGVTTVADADGMRAGYAKHVLSLVGRKDVPVAAGAHGSLDGVRMGELEDHDTYWGTDVAPVPGPVDEAIELLDRSVDGGSTIVAIGPCTNLALLEQRRPGRLRGARVVVMGGWLNTPGPDLPAWGPDMDWNVQSDPRAFTMVLAGADVTLVSLTATLRTAIRRTDLARLRRSGPLGDLVARQAVAHAEQYDMAATASAHLGVPPDALNFQHDALACAVALGWDGVPVDALTVSPHIEEGALRIVEDAAGSPVRFAQDADGERFADVWLEAVEMADAR